MGGGIDVDPESLRSHANSIESKVAGPVQEASEAANLVGGGDVLSYGLVNINAAVAGQMLGQYAKQIIETAAGMAQLVSATVDDIATTYEECDESVASDFDALGSEVED